MQNIKSFDTKPYMTIGIIVVNIIVFVLMSLSGSTLDAQYMAAHGAMYPEYIKDGQYWRLFTSMFMHSDYISCVRHVWKCIIVYRYAL